MTRVPKKFKYCNHDPTEYTCQNCGECVICRCVCDKIGADGKIYDSINDKEQYPRTKKGKKHPIVRKHEQIEKGFEVAKKMMEKKEEE